MYRFWVCQEMQFPDEITQKKKVRRASSLIIASRYVPYVGIIQIRLWVEAELRFLSAGFHQLPVCNFRNVHRMICIAWNVPIYQLL